MDQNRSHRPIVHLSIVTRAVSQCSVIINHALLFVTHQFILAINSKYGILVPAAVVEYSNSGNKGFEASTESGSASVECKMKKCFRICRRRVFGTWTQLNAATANADSEEKFQSICIIYYNCCPKTLLIAAQLFTSHRSRIPFGPFSGEMFSVGFQVFPQNRQLLPPIPGSATAES